MPLLRYKCPICGDIDIDVPGEIVRRAPFFPVPFTYIHGEPKHALVLYIDANFNVRGHELSTIVQADNEIVVTDDTLLLRDVIQDMDAKSLAAFIECVLTRIPLIVLGAPRTRKSAILLLKRIVWWRGIKYKESGEKGAYDRPVWNTFSMKIENYSPQSKYLIGLAEKIKNAPIEIGEVILMKEIEKLLAIARIILNKNIEDEKDVERFLQWDKILSKESKLIFNMANAIKKEKIQLRLAAR